MNDEKLSKLYNEIAEVVIDTIPEKWFKVYLYGEVGEGAQESYFYYYTEENSTPIYSHSIFELFNVPEEEYFKKWHRLLDCIKRMKKEFIDNDQEAWTNFTMIFDNTGKFNIDFNYDDLSDENSHERMIIWEYEHLGLMPKSNSGKKYLEKHLKNLEDTKN
ncbi:antitoxin YezG family protein [Bacillus cereus group sp. TH177-1LC]|uniref:antitoxin YezG family protein n=1 Tax=Bacillus cereus group sp. TH177-1LC TaxID=3018055 RepID=UPI0022E81D45|nr:antitoxin YezG family protein [Bacillus cereus group sp. TH177-1LC]MDA1640947.1 antitoxin YezG family protein [Bacillus cereus group sp. TH177-1LC]